MLAPSPVDPASGYRYYDTGQLAEAATVGLLRRAGIPLADIAEFLARPSGEQLDGWERSLRAEVHVRRDALAEVRARLGLGTARTRGVTMVEITPVEDREGSGGCSTSSVPRGPTTSTPATSGSPTSTPTSSTTSR